MLAALRTSLPRPAACRPPPTLSLPLQKFPSWCWSHHPPCSANNLWAHELLTNSRNCRPSAPVPQNALFSAASAGTLCASAPASTDLLPASIAAASRHSPPSRDLPSDARPPGSDRNALLLHPHNAFSLTPKPVLETSLFCCGWIACPHCRVPSHLHPGRKNAGTAAWFADSTNPASPPLPLA